MTPCKTLLPLNTMSDIESLKSWVAQQLDCPIESLQWQPLSGDASFRRYVRVAFNGQSYIAALAPPATEKNHAFVDIAKRLQNAHVNAPIVMAVDYDNGFLLQNDLGQVDLQSVLNAGSVDHWYGLAMQQIAAMQKVETQELAPYDRAALALELSYFRTWFIEAMLAYQLNADEEKLLEAFFNSLLDSAAEQPQAFVHRDYHCRNIMCQGDRELACIDFQDALHGPITYDLVSLLRDCYVVWPETKVHAWVEDFRRHYFAEVDKTTFLQWFDLMGLQRHIKVLGIFARLSLRDGKHGYLNDLPTVVRYVQQVAAQHSTAAAFSQWFETKIVPLAKQQAWGRTL